MEECYGVILAGGGDAERSTRLEVDGVQRLALSHDVTDRRARVRVEYVTKPGHRRSAIYILLHFLMIYFFKGNTQ